MVEGLLEGKDVSGEGEEGKEVMGEERREERRERGEK